jgi:hypothetical protein
MGPLVPEELRRHHAGVTETKCSSTNIESTIGDDRNSRLTKEIINKRRTASSTPSITNKRGCMLDVQQPTHSRTRNEYLCSLKTTTDSSQKEPSSGSGSHTNKGLEGRVEAQHDSGGIDKGPPDKHDQCTDNREGTGNVPGPQQLMYSQMREQQPNSHQMAVHSFQHKSTVGSSVQVQGEAIQRRSDKMSIGHQTVDPSFQMKSPVDSCIPSCEESKRGQEGAGDTKRSYTNVGPEKSRGQHKDVVHKRRPYVNAVTGVRNDELCRIPNKKQVPTVEESR